MGFTTEQAHRAAELRWQKWKADHIGDHVAAVVESAPYLNARHRRALVLALLVEHPRRKPRAA